MNIARTQHRKIIHIDMDAFFAAVEQRDHPQYRNKPVIVGGKPNSRGVVAACSYEARKFGIHSAMPSAEAARRCPNAIFATPRFSAYQAVSQQIHTIFQQYAPLVEPLSMDEAFLDVSQSTRHNGSATLLATEIRNRIHHETQLTASAGISYNKFLAKVASDVNKPNGQFTITPQSAPQWLRQLPIGKFFGVGKATEARMHKAGIRNGEDLLNHGKAALAKQFGTMGEYFYNIARGIDHRPVAPHRERKSISVEHTFQRNLSTRTDMLQCLNRMADKVCGILQQKELTALTIGIKAKYPNFQVATRAHTLSTPANEPQLLQHHIPALLDKTEAQQRQVRLLGFKAANLAPASSNTQQQLNLMG